MAAPQVAGELALVVATGHHFPVAGHHGADGHIVVALGGNRLVDRQSHRDDVGVGGVGGFD